MRVLIAGCGYVGTALGLGLCAGGHEVYGLRRSAEALPAPLRPLSADLRAPGSLRVVPAGVEVLVYCAAADARTEEGYRAAYVEGLENVLGALGSAGQPPTRLLFVSSTSVYGQDDGSRVDETSPTEPPRFTGRILLEGERRVHERGGHVVRFGGIYGPGRRRLLDRVARGEARFRSGHYTNRIHREDAAGVLQHFVSIGRVPDTTLGVDCEPALEEDVLRYLAGRLRAPEPLPEAAASPGGAGSKRCSNARLLATGYAFRYPSFREGYDDVIDRLDDRGAR